MAAKSRSLKSLVQEVLMNFPESRDNDEYCVLAVWYRQHASLKNPECSYKTFQNLFLTKQITSADAITRCRRQLQESHPELRGKTWIARHVKATVLKNRDERDSQLFS